MNDDQLASLLFPNSPSTNASPTTATVSAAPLQATEHDAATKLYCNTSRPAANVETAPRDDRPLSELTEDEQAQRLYGGTDPTVAHRTAVQAIFNAGLQDHLHDPKTAQEIAAGWAEVFSSHQLNATQSAELADIGASVMRNPPTPELLETWSDTAIQNLQTDYGVEGAGRALQDARAYVASVPGAADMLDSLGLGSHPKVVAIAAARGRAMRMSGKLK